jgi:GNAT superfamily N-acetyltransferase
MVSVAGVSIAAVTAVDAAQAERFAAWNAVFTAVDRASFGPQEQGWTLAEMRLKESSPYSRTIWRAALDAAGSVVGSALVELPTADNPHLAYGRIAVLPGTDGHDTQDALLEQAEAELRAAGRDVLLIETDWPTGGADTVGEGYLARRAFEQAQTVLRNEMALPADGPRLAGLAAGDAAYVLETTVDRMPDDWLADRAVLQSRMSTDPPLGDLALDPEDWTAERLRDDIGRTLASGRRYVETVAREVASGVLVGFTTITVSAGDPTLAYQWDTLVLPEHRGHGLGLRLKAANALAVAGAVPTATRIRTWNADDNAHMLAVNTALGYRHVGYQREWQKRLTSG